MKTLNEVIAMAERCTLPYPGDCLNCEYFNDNSGNDCRCKILADALEYLKRYKADLEKKCSNCKCWHGHKAYSPDDPWREEYFCGYETWTYPDDSCSRWEEME